MSTMILMAIILIVDYDHDRDDSRVHVHVPVDGHSNNLSVLVSTQFLWPNWNSGSKHHGYNLRDKDVVDVFVVV